MLVCSAAAGANRPPAVAGAFYPADAGQLRRQVENLLGAVRDSDGTARAVIAPHAGYVYSGATAARAFAALASSGAKRIILLGPSHHAVFAGGALPERGVTSFATPLGEVAVDREAIATLRDRDGFDGPAAAHGPEHCLEVELPFLQVVLPEARIVPILVGLDSDRETCRRLAEGLSSVIDANTVVVVSSDFTHHGTGYRYAPFAGDPELASRLVALGRATAERLTSMDPTGFWTQVEVSGDTVCGRKPLVVLGELLASGFEGSGSVLDVTTSGHVMRDWEQSVTYVAAAFQGAWRGWQNPAPAPPLEGLAPDQGEALLGLARATLESHLEHGASVARWFAAYGSGDCYRASAGAFVTLHNVGERARRSGRLRACMGVIEARQPMLEAVVHAAVSAVYDPRFPRVTATELDELELEVSVLSPTRGVAGPQAIRVGEHGVVLSKNGRRAVFLPQVAPEQGWDRDTMLDNLARKAGLPTDGWRSGARFEVFTAQVFSEEAR